MFENLQFNKVTQNLSFDVKTEGLPIYNAIFNGLRRILITDIPIIGFLFDSDESTIDIEENYTEQSNEYIQHRIGMLVLNIDTTYIDNFDSAKNSIELDLDIKSTNDGMLTRNITTEDCIIKIDNEIVKSSDVFPHDKVSKEPCLLLRLSPGDSLKLKATAIKSTCRQNSIFQSISGGAWIPKSNPNSVETEPLKRERDTVPGIYTFHFENIVPKITHKYLFDKSIEIFINKLNTLKIDMQGNSTTTTSDIVSKITADDDTTFRIMIYNENDTIGNIIQSYIYDNYVSTGKKFDGDRRCVFCGYAREDPLKNDVTIAFTFEGNEHEIVSAKTFLALICEEIVNTYLLAIKSEWNQFCTI